MTDHHHVETVKDNSLDRLLFFSDGVFAIAITLLSIELHPPHEWNGTMADLWGRGWPMLGAFAISFVVIGVFWNSHRRIFTQVHRFSQGVFVFNLALLGAIALMPFVTNLLYINGPRGDSVLIYLSLVSVAGLLQGSMLAWAVFVSKTVDPAVHPLRRITAIATSALMPGLVCAALLLMFGGISLGLLLALIAGIVGLIVLRVWSERRYAHDRANAVAPVGLGPDEPSAA